MRTKEQAAGVRAPAAVNESPILNQQNVSTQNYKSNRASVPDNSYRPCAICDKAIAGKPIFVEPVEYCPDCNIRLDEHSRQELKRNRTRAVIRLIRCFACEGCFGSHKMSNCLAICKSCYAAILENSNGCDREIEKVLSRIRKYLRGRLK
jgi:hypothetical protein